jgi:hypothetical protein
MLAAITLMLSAISSSLLFAQKWTHDTFEDFAAGRLDQAGQNLYVGRDGSIRVVHRFDLNQDGYIDLIFNNTHDTSTLHAATLVRRASDGTNQLAEIAVPGSLKAAAGDLNKDGRQELVFCPAASGLQDPRQMLTIMWGDQSGWPAQRAYRLLPVNAAQDVAIADLNRDTWPDIVALCGSEESRHGLGPEQTVLRIYWGSEAGFLLKHRLDIPAPAGVDLHAADFDGDKSLDVAVLAGDEVTILWADDPPDRKRPSKPQTTRIPLHKSGTRCLCTGDLNDDGRTDLVVGAQSDEIVVVSGTGTRSPGQVAVVPAFPASHIACADIDGDSLDDLVFTNLAVGRAMGGEQTAAKSTDHVRIMWGNGNVPDKSKSSQISATYAAAVAPADLNGDGQLDLAIAVYQTAKTFAAESKILFNKGSREFRVEPFVVSTSGASDVIAVSERGVSGGAVVFCNSLGGTPGDGRICRFVASELRPRKSASQSHAGREDILGRARWFSKWKAHDSQGRKSRHQRCVRPRSRWVSGPHSGGI